MATFFQWLGLEPSRKRKRSPMAGTEGHLKQIAERMDRSEDNFLRTLMKFGEISYPEAKKVFRYYKKHRLIKRDLTNQTWTVKTGAFLDRDVIRLALTKAR
jgi:hypothetical protein